MRRAIVFFATLVALLAIADIHGAQTLTGAFNSYRATQGLPPLTELAVLDQNAQGGSDQACASGGYHLPTPPLGSYSVWQVYGYLTQDALATAELADAQIRGIVANPNYNAIGVGVTTPCLSFGLLWTIEIGHANGILPQPTPTLTSIPTCNLVMQALNLLRQAAQLPPLRSCT
jgi:Cysteine-rich secretory protein family